MDKKNFFNTKKQVFQSDLGKNVICNLIRKTNELFLEMMIISGIWAKTDLFYVILENVIFLEMLILSDILR